MTATMVSQAVLVVGGVAVVDDGGGGGGGGGAAGVSRMAGTRTNYLRICARHAYYYFFLLVVLLLVDSTDVVLESRIRLFHNQPQPVDSESRSKESKIPGANLGSNARLVMVGKKYDRIELRALLWEYVPNLYTVDADTVAIVMRQSSQKGK